MSTIVITGAAGALGSAVARYLSSKGLRVALFDIARATEALAALAAELGPGARAFHGDIASPEAWASALPKIETELGAPDGAVFEIAGGWQGGKPLYASDDDVYRAMIAMNLDSAHGSLRALLPGMVARKSGSIVVIGSRAVERPWTSTNATEYAASKAAVVAMAQAVAEEVRDFGVRVNSIMPSTLDTPANRRAMPDADATKWVSLDSCARVIAFLLSEDARDVSGAALPVYGRA